MSEIKTKTTEEVVPTLTEEDLKICNEYSKDIDLTEAPKILMKAMQTGGSSRECSGLIISKKNLVDIYSYVQRGVTLPENEEGVKNMMPYEKILKDNSGNEMKDENGEPKKDPILNLKNYVTLFKKIRDHASRWKCKDGFETRIPGIGAELKIFANKFSNYLDTMALVLISTPEMIKFTTSTQVGDQNVHFLLKNDDNEMKQSAIDLLNTLKVEVKKHQDEVQKLLNDLNKYYNELGNIDIETNQLNTSLNDEYKDGDNAELLLRQKDLQNDIDIFQKEYNKMVGLAFTGTVGLVFPPPIVVITWAVTGGIFGAKAEKIRKEKNRLIEELYRVNKEIAANDKMREQVGDMISDVTKMSQSISEAIIGLQNLDCVWMSIDKYIDNSIAELDAVKETDHLAVLVSRLRNTASSWKEVRDITTDLISSFANAKEEVSRLQIEELNPWKKI